MIHDDFEPDVSGGCPCTPLMQMVRVEYSHGLSPEAQRMAECVSPPLVLMGSGGDFTRAINLVQTSTVGEAFFPSPRGKLCMTNAHIAKISIANDAVVIRNAAPGLEVDWSIPAAIGEVVERVRWGVGVVEAFCAGVALGLVGLTLALWVVM